MNPVLLPLLGLCWFFGTGWSWSNGTGPDPDLDLDLDLDLVLDLDLDPLRRVDPRFLSVTIDASLAAEERFMLLLRSQRVRTLAAALSPAYLRFGGTRQDFMVFSPQRRGGADPPTDCDPLPPPLEKRLKQDWVHQQQVLQAEDRNRKFHPVQFSELTVDSLASFSSCCGLALIFGLNALLRTPENVWNSSNAAALLSYTQQRRYALAWELGNEPNSFERKAGVRVGGQQLGLDFLRLRKMLNASPWQRDAALYGPDVGQPRDHRGDLLTGFLQTGSGSINACTWHHYYLNGRDASLEDFLDPGVLDSLALKAHEVLETVRSGAPGVPVWLGETSSAFGGGAPGLSDAFAAGFMWLDKLGLGARLGLDVVLRQVLLGAGSYHLIDEDLDPLPDFWLSVLHKRLVGPEVLNLKSRSPFARLRVYAHCATRRRGAVVLLTLNLSPDPAVLRGSVLASGPVEAFVLQGDGPGRAGLLSRGVLLNGVLLQMLDDRTLPELRPLRLPPSPRLHLPGYSLSFLVLEAGAPPCL